jgi:hypothetical protein
MRFVRGLPGFLDRLLFRVMVCIGQTLVHSNSAHLVLITATFEDVVWPIGMVTEDQLLVLLVLLLVLCAGLQ